MNSPASENTPQRANEPELIPASPLQDIYKDNDLTLRSLGEYLLPLFLAAMEACWVDGALLGLAGVGILGTYAPLMPFWAPPLLLLLALSIFRLALQKEESSAPTDETASSRKLLDLPGLRPLFLGVTLLAVFLIWLAVYSPTFSLVDPGWLGALASDLLLLNMHFYQAVFILALAFYLCWRGMRLAQLAIETGHIFRRLWIGLLILLFAILLRAGQSNSITHRDDIVLLILLPVFLYLALSAHALARLAFIRSEHPVGLDGSALAQERSTLSVITLAGLLLLVLTLIVGSFFNANVFNSLQPIWQALGTVYNWLVQGFSEVAVIIVTPFFWLSQWWFERFPPNLPKLNQQHPVQQQPQVLRIDHTSPAVVLTAKIMVPVLLFLALALLLYLVLRKRRRIKITLNLKGGDVHESVWSWSLFWFQVLSFWRTFFRRLFPAKVHSEETASRQEAIAGPPAARTVREIYQALLRKASFRGYGRKRAETPHEFQQRLDEHFPELEPQLGLLTEAYALTRYGGELPNDTELQTLRGFWNELEQKWS